MFADFDRSQMVLGLTAFAEASNQGEEGITAQIHSVLNRFNAKKWFSGTTLAATCLFPFAYSAWNTTNANRMRAAEAPTTDPILQLCFTEAALAINGKTADPTNGATHYYADGTTVPDWADPKTGAIFTVQIGMHRFYKNVK